MATDIKILIVDDGTLASLPVLAGLKKQGFDYIEFAVNSNCMFNYLDRGHVVRSISNWSRIEIPGKEFINTLRKQEKYNDIPIVMLAQPTIALNFQDGLWDENVRIVNKPLNFKTLSEAILEVLEKKEIPH